MDAAVVEPVGVDVGCDGVCVFDADLGRLVRFAWAIYSRLQPFGALGQDVCVDVQDL